MSHWFLDLAVVLLETINTRDLANLLVRTGRLGYRKIDIIKDETVDPRTYGVYKGLGTNLASILPCERTGHYCDSTTSPHPSRPKHLKSRNTRCCRLCRVLH